MMINSRFWKRNIRKIGITSGILLAIFLMINFLVLKNTNHVPLKINEFECYQHEPGASYKYTISYRGKSFLVNNKEDVVLNAFTGEEILEKSKEFKQIQRCIKMFKLAEEGFIGESPAQLVNGKFQTSSSKKKSNDNE